VAGRALLSVRVVSSRAEASRRRHAGRPLAAARLIGPAAHYLSMVAAAEVRDRLAAVPAALVLARCSPRCEAHEQNRERTREQADQKPDGRRATLLVGKRSGRDRDEDPCRQCDCQRHGEQSVQRTGEVESHASQDTRPTRAESSLRERPQHVRTWIAEGGNPHLDRLTSPGRRQDAAHV